LASRKRNNPQRRIYERRVQQFGRAVPGKSDSERDVYGQISRTRTRVPAADQQAGEAREGRGCAEDGLLPGPVPPGFPGN